MSYKYAVACLLSALSVTAHAEPTKHIVGANLGYGDVSYDVNNGHDDGDMFLGDVYYRYMFDQTSALKRVTKARLTALVLYSLAQYQKSPT